jgi:molybdate transport system substrate-binding protein
VAFLAIVDNLGIAPAVKAKAKPEATTEAVGRNVTSGASDFAVLPVSEILPVKGAELGGVFPAEVQTYVVMAAGVSARAQGRAAQDFVAFLMSPSNTAVVKQMGMERLP